MLWGPNVKLATAHPGATRQPLAKPSIGTGAPRSRSLPEASLHDARQPGEWLSPSTSHAGAVTASRAPSVEPSSADP